MKKYFVLLVLYFTCHSTHAQYRCIPNTDIHGNPAGNFTDDWYPSGSTIILNYAATPVWSPVYNIGFTFLFNGQPVTHFKISNTGVLTFDTLAITPPPAGAVVLPDAQIPDKSICVTGIANANSNSKVYLLKEGFYTVPVLPRRVWVMFNNFSDSIGGQGAFVSWAIVLEENTNNIYLVDEYFSNGSNILVSAGIQVDDTTAYMVPGSPAVPSLSGHSFYTHDNVYYGFYPGNSLAVDGALTEAATEDFMTMADSAFDIKVKFRNLGTDTVTTFTLQYSINGGPPQTETFTGLAIPCGNSQLITFANQWMPLVTGAYQFSYAVNNINSAADLDTSNNTLQQQVYVAATLPLRRPLFEQAKGTWCTYCGYWTIKYDSILAVNRSKASDIKLEEGGYNLAWSQSEVYTRTRSFYKTYAFPSAYANGKLAVSNSNNYWAGCPWHVTQNMIDSLSLLNGLFYIQPQLSTNGYTATISGTVTSAVGFPAGSHCRIMVALIQDTIITPVQGSSGESLFVNTMLKMFPDAHGTYIGAPLAGRVDSINFSCQVTDTSTILSRLRVVVFVQDSVTREVWQVAEAPVVNACAPVYTTSFIPLCTGDSVNVNGAWIKTNAYLPQMFTGANGCDSLHVNVVQQHWMSTSISVYQTVNIKMSNVYLYTGDSLVSIAWYDVTNQQFIAGATGTQITPSQPGMYSVMITNQMGCTYMSNIVYFNCTPTTKQQAFTICNGDSIQVGNLWLSLPGLYVDSLLTPTGCDSIIKTTINVITPDTSLQVSNNILAAVSGYTFYEWIDCNTGLVLSSGAFDTLFAATTTGWYQLRITDSSGCSMESGCVAVMFTGLTVTQRPSFTLLPNPATEYMLLTLNIPMNATAQVSDMAGKAVMTFPVSGATTYISIEKLPAGVYSLSLLGTVDFLTAKRFVVIGR